MPSRTSYNASQIKFEFCERHFENLGILGAIRSCVVSDVNREKVVDYVTRKGIKGTHMEESNTYFHVREIKRMNSDRKVHICEVRFKGEEYDEIMLTVH